MTSKVRARRLETRAARLRLAVRRKPHAFAPVAPGVALGYRRNSKGAGTWVVRVADGRGSSWTKAIGYADDIGDANGKDILTWWQAILAAVKLVRGSDDAAGKPATVSRGR